VVYTVSDRRPEYNDKYLNKYKYIRVTWTLLSGDSRLGICMGEPMGNLGHTHTHTHQLPIPTPMGMGLVMGNKIGTHTHTHGGYTHCNPWVQTCSMQLECSTLHHCD
jgi:hypothetical protein